MGLGNEEAAKFMTWCPNVMNFLQAPTRPGLLGGLLIWHPVQDWSEREIGTHSRRRRADEPWRDLYLCMV